MLTSRHDMAVPHTTSQQPGIWLTIQALPKIDPVKILARMAEAFPYWRSSWQFMAAEEERVTLLWRCGHW